MNRRGPGLMQASLALAMLANSEKTKAETAVLDVSNAAEATKRAETVGEQQAVQQYRMTGVHAFKGSIVDWSTKQRRRRQTHRGKRRGCYLG